MPTSSTGKVPAIIATTSFVMATALSAPQLTGSFGGNVTIPSAGIIMGFSSDNYCISTSSNNVVACAGGHSPDHGIFSLAQDTFGKMRGSTEEEAELYAAMLNRLSSKTDLNIFEI